MEIAEILQNMRDELMQLPEARGINEMFYMTEPGEDE
jgi:hypothetical protein